VSGVFIPQCALEWRAEPSPPPIRLADVSRSGYDGRLLSMSLCFNPEDTEAIFLVVESDALDDAGDFLRHGPAFRDCDIHAWGFIFPWKAVPCVTHQEDGFAGIWLPRAGTSQG
jgi:hypothetical protein